MAQPTQPYKRSLAGSVGAGMKSVFGSEGKRFYTLVHKVSSKYHKAGESQQIIVDQIELGRDPRCQVRFDESFTTVSRRHAAIVKDGENWKLVQLSKVNTTYLNGHKVQNEWYLQNGDEIQLSTNGPKLGFIIPEGKKGTIGSIGLTARLNLFRKQALRPYKNAIWGMAAVLLLVIGIGTWKLTDLNGELVKKSKDIASLIELNKDNTYIIDSLGHELIENNQKIKDYEAKIEKMSKQISYADARVKEAMEKIQSIEGGGQPSESGLEQCMKDTYFCYCFIEAGEGSDKIVWSSGGTAFLLNNGRLVTAQHVVNPFMAYPQNDESAMLNAVMNQSPEFFMCYFLAVSPKGDKIRYKYPLTKSIFHTGKFSLHTIGTYPYENMNLPVKMVTECDYRDYAWVQTDKVGSLEFDAPFSKSMPLKTHLDILGFPQGVGAEDINNVAPIYSESFVAKAGLDVDGCILLSNSETDHGNSGGPVFAVKNGKYVVVGILSGANRLGSKTDNKNKDGKWKDRVVPISAIL